MVKCLALFYILSKYKFVFQIMIYFIKETKFLFPGLSVSPLNRTCLTT